MIDDFFEKKPLSIGSLSNPQRATYEHLKGEWDKQLAVTAKATEELKKRGYGGTNKPKPKPKPKKNKTKKKTDAKGEK